VDSLGWAVLTVCSKIENYHFKSGPWTPWLPLTSALGQGKRYGREYFSELPIMWKPRRCEKCHDVTTSRGRVHWFRVQGDSGNQKNRDPSIRFVQAVWHGGAAPRQTHWQKVDHKALTLMPGQIWTVWYTWIDLSNENKDRFTVNFVTAPHVSKEAQHLPPHGAQKADDCGSSNFIIIPPLAKFVSLLRPVRLALVLNYGQETIEYKWNRNIS